MWVSESLNKCNTPVALLGWPCPCIFDGTNCKSEFLVPGAPQSGASTGVARGKSMLCSYRHSVERHTVNFVKNPGLQMEFYSMIDLECMIASIGRKKRKNSGFTILLSDFSLRNPVILAT